MIMTMTIVIVVITMIMIMMIMTMAIVLNKSRENVPAPPRPRPCAHFRPSLTDRDGKMRMMRMKTVMIDDVDDQAITYSVKVLMML